MVLGIGQSLLRKETILFCSPLIKNQNKFIVIGGSYKMNKIGLRTGMKLVPLDAGINPYLNDW